MMALNVFLITNQVDEAIVAQNAGVTHIFVDLEQRGKDERQKHVNSVKSKHTVEDIQRLRPVLHQSKLLVRIDPMGPWTAEQVDAVVAAGADIVMLPMFHHRTEVEQFLTCLNARAQTMLLLETQSAFSEAASILSLPGIDSVHVGLNDLHLSCGMDFMFEPLANGMVDDLARLAHSLNVPFGFGGIAQLGMGALPAECILCEHYRLGSSQVILSRSFINTETENLGDDLEHQLKMRLKKLREFEGTIASQPIEFFEKNRLETAQKIREIAQKMRAQKTTNR